MKTLLRGALLAALCLCPWPASAQESAAESIQHWPSRPVRIVSPFAAGGAADMLARMVADHLSSTFKQQFFVENRTGAGGVIGVQSVAAAPADGYNLVITNISMLVTAPVMNPKLAYHPTRDLTNIAYIAGAPVVIAVNGSSGIKSLDQLVAIGRKQGKPLSYSSSGIGTNGHLLGESFGKRAKIDVVHIPYKGATIGIADLIAGHINFGVPVLGSVAPHLRSGALVPLALSAGQRVPEYPDIATFKELGYPELTTTTWFSLSGPAGLPRALAERINREVAAMVKKPDIQARILRDGMIPDTMSIDAFDKFIAAETARWAPVIEAAGLVAK
ncbi:MAG: tripartite tricarboxylate transporter substrate binding protein [Hyphomicrobiales bacterium]|nr:tripartite tricarboxylate transporter substrate binding protein [Hyphomicrobiales bacterium]